jgi:hypothetical protein
MRASTPVSAAIAESRAARFTVGARVKTHELVPFIMIESRH